MTLLAEEVTVPSKAPTDIATMARAIRTSSSVKPRDELTVFLDEGFINVVPRVAPAPARVRRATATESGFARRCRAEPVRRRLLAGARIRTRSDHRWRRS